MATRQTNFLDRTDKLINKAFIGALVMAILFSLAFLAAVVAGIYLALQNWG
jgi:hypothetical protein